jgi:uncharacterized cofD-like protein
MGNLFLTALTDQTGSFEGAIEKASDILNINGKVLPATLEDVHLGAEFVDKMKIMGEVRITQYGYKMRIKKLFLSKEAPSNPRAVEAIKEADCILVGPGSLFTSILPNFLHQEIKDGFEKSKAKKIYIANVSTERGETDDFKLSDHYKEVKKYAGDVNVIIANNRVFESGSGDGYITPVEIDIKKNIKLADISNQQNNLYHDSDKLAQEINNVIG